MKSYNYFYTKQLDAICFSKNPKQYFSGTNCTEKYLEFLYQKIVLSDITMINERMKYNLLELINYIRFNGNLSSKDIEMINEIIIKINSSKVSFYPYQGYLAEEFDLRMPEGKAELNFLDDNQIEELLAAIEFDFTVLNSLLCSEEEFNKSFLFKLRLNQLFFGSINKLSSEIPALINMRMIRIMTVIMLNKKYKKRKYEIKNYNRKTFNTVIKEGDKLLKKMKN